jgi:purine-nucleoside phosphorylase
MTFQRTSDYSAAAKLEIINKIYNNVFSTLPETHRSPKLAIICGSGLARIGNLIKNSVKIPYDSIEGFPRSTVSGHGNAILVGELNGVMSMIFLGRFHAYEGYEPHTTALPVRLAAKMKIGSLIVTNASGSVDSNRVKVGDIMVIEDHFSIASLAGINPLHGENLEEFGPRFPSISQAYHPRSYDWTMEAARIANVPLEIIKKGIYCAALGPSYESPTEVKFLQSVGGAAVGMSTIPEVIMAAHSGIKKLTALSLITNEPVEIGQEGPTHEDVLTIVNARMLEIEKLVEALAPIISNA